MLSLWKYSKFLNTTDRMWYFLLWDFTQTTGNNWVHLTERGASSRRCIWFKNNGFWWFEKALGLSSQRFLNLSTYQNHLEVKTHTAGPSSFLFSMTRYELILFISNKIPGDVDITVARNTLWKPIKQSKLQMNTISRAT